MTDKPQVSAVACSVFRPELDALRSTGVMDCHVYYLDSELHMRPNRLFRHMNRLVDKLLGKGRQVILIYGDCHAHMSELCQPGAVVRTTAVNCCELLMGREQYRLDRQSRPFFLLPEWTLRWEQILGQLMDLSREMTIEMIREAHTRLVYLDTGVMGIPRRELEGCSRYFQLPCEVRRISLDHFVERIVEAINSVSERRENNG